MFDLTPREREAEVIRLHGFGWSDPAIALELGCTDRTVLRIRQRLGLRAWEKWQQTRQARAA